MTARALRLLGLGPEWKLRVMMSPDSSPSWSEGHEPRRPRSESTQWVLDVTMIVSWWPVSLEMAGVWSPECPEPVISSVDTRWQMGPWGLASGHSPPNCCLLPRPGSSQHLTGHQATTFPRSIQSPKSSTRSHRDDCDALLSRYRIHWTWWNSLDKRVSVMSDTRQENVECWVLTVDYWVWCLWILIGCVWHHQDSGTTYLLGIC